MRVLVISLLRLGDFIQILPVIQGIKMQTGAREVDVLTHHSVKALAPMLNGINEWWTINRDELQAGLGRADLPLLTSFAVLKEKLDQINGREYDAVINLTQTEFSAWIAGYIQTTNRTGLVFDNKGEARFHSPWFQYLDDHVPLSVKDIFHYTDIFFYGCGLKGAEREWRMRETRTGTRELAALALGNHEKIVLQICTSDEKKNWSATAWLTMITQLQLFRPHAQFVLLGSPAEAERIESLRAEAIARGVRATAAILSLEGAFSLLKSASLLVTGDTSIKHLANAADIPILELSLGSSDYRRTGAYRADSLILQPRPACAPCAHSAKCSQPRHECGEGLTPHLVSAVAHHYLAQDWPGVRAVAREYQGEVDVLRTRILSAGFWIASDVNLERPHELVEKIIERSTWKFVLNREYLNPLAQFGSEGLHLRREIAGLFAASATPVDINPHLEFLEARADAFGQRAATLITSVKRRLPTIPEIRSFIIEHDPHSRALPWLEQIAKKDLAGVVEIGGLRRVHTQLERYFHQSQVKVKLLRSLKSQFTELK